VQALDEAPDSVAMVYPLAELIDSAGKTLESPLDRIESAAARPHRRLARVLWALSMCDPFYGVIKTEYLRRTRLIGPFFGNEITCDREPLKHGGFQAQYEAGFSSTVATLFTLLLRDMTGIGQQVDVSIQEVVNSTLVVNQPYYRWTGGVQGRRHPVGTRFGQVMPCQDGYCVSQPGGGATWDDLATFYGREDLRHERFATAAQRWVNGQALDQIITEAAKDRSMAAMFTTASETYRMLCGIVQTPEDLANCPQLEARGLFQEVEHPVIGQLKVPFRLWHMSEAAAQYRKPAPLLGQHNQEVYSQLRGYTESEIIQRQVGGVI
jgi:crotonobetainyl-CoA:carnitine CoA-transferase CaiB-like acyl-CoA transferase